MSFLRKGETRWGKRSAFVTAVAIGAFQALAIAGAGSAVAAGTCTYNPSTDTINVTINAGTTSTLGVDSTNGNILFDTAPCGSANNSNTTSIVVLGQPSADETLVIDNTDGEFNPAITWAVDLGTGTGDIVEIDGNDATDDAVVVTDDNFTLNGGGGELNGVEEIDVNGNDGADTIDGTGLNNVVLVADGGLGDDWIAGGGADDTFTGGGGVDTISYADRTGCVIFDNTTNPIGEDANCDGDLADAGDEADTLTDFAEVMETGSGNDTLVGSGGTVETFVPGDGDDDITGQANDTIDYSSSSAGVTIDPAAGTVEGQGSDTFTGPTSFVGSPFDDTLVWDGTTTAFSGGDGVDTVDASADTSTGVNIDLDALDGGGPVDDLEVALGGTGNDTLTGNDLRNILDGGDGDDTLSGAAGNDRLVGGEGNDSYSGGSGADTVSFGGATQGVTVDVSLGFASGQGDDSIANDIEIVSGSKFSDNITTGQTGTGGALNFRVRGRAGNDLLTGSTSNDTLLGGAGNDVIRAGNGDDILRGGKGRDRGFGGGGDDVCRGIERERGCEA